MPSQGTERMSTERLERACDLSGIDMTKPSSEMVVTWLIASSTCRFSNIHCYQFDVSASAFPLELEGAGFSSSWLDDRQYTVCHRTRSFIDGNLRLGRGREPLLPGEIRELSVLVYSGNPGATACGNLNIMMAYGKPMETYSPNTIDENGFIFGLNFLPLVLVGTKPDPSEDKCFTMNASHAIYMSTARTRMVVNDGLSIQDTRGLHINTLTQYISGGRTNLSVFPMQHNFSMLHKDMQRIRAQSAMKLKDLLPPLKSGKKDDDVTRINDLLDTALSTSECTTIGAFLDMHASEAFQGITTAFMSNPCHAPLYICTCVLIAGNPSLVDSDDCRVGSAADRIYRSFLNLVPMQDAESGSCLEIVIMYTIEVLKEGVKKRIGESMLTDGHKACLTHMMRQGRALCLELVGQCPPNVEYYRVSSRDARHRVLLRMMSDVNTWIASGVWRERLITSTDDIENGLNKRCFEWASAKVVHFFTCGIYSMSDNTATVIPASHGAGTFQCKNCANLIMATSIMANMGNTAGCNRCNALFCKDCSDKCLDETMTELGRRGISEFVYSSRLVNVNEMGKIWWCKACVAECERAKASEKKRRKKSDKAARAK
jgi:hypothetical protein